jgi:hypothetical protein
LCIIAFETSLVVELSTNQAPNPKRFRAAFQPGKLILEVSLVPGQEAPCTTLRIAIFVTELHFAFQQKWLQSGHDTIHVPTLQSIGFWSNKPKKELRCHNLEC